MFSWSLRVYLLLLNIIEKWFYCWSSRYKKLKRQNFSTNWQFTVPSLYLLLLNIIEKRFCFKFLDTKNQRGKIFTRTDNSRSLRFVCFFLMFSTQKIKEAEFFNELTIHSRFVVFASFKYYREVVLYLMFSIQKIKKFN